MKFKWTIFSKTAVFTCTCKIYVKIIVHNFGTFLHIFALTWTCLVASSSVPLCTGCVLCVHENINHCRVRLLATPWTVAHQTPLSMGFPRQEYWSGLPFPSPGDLPDPGIKPRSPELQTDFLPSEPPGKPWCFNQHKRLVNVSSRVSVITEHFWIEPLSTETDTFQ